MFHPRSICVAAGILGCLAGYGHSAAPGSDPGIAGQDRSTSQPASNPSAATRPAGAPAPEAIRKVVRDLNHPQPARRRAAIRQLAEWGPLAFPELRAAIARGSHEEALSARALLQELEGAILIGATVCLQLDRTRIAWDEPVTLTVIAENATPGPLRVPWPEPPASQPASEAAREARQVACMMDAADFLVVTGPDGEEIDLRVEPIDRSPEVYREVNLRARDNPPSHVIPPGARASLDILLFNRGWARYPMLAPGEYTIGFAYQPQWKDESWTASGFGCVRSEPLRLEVTRGAPEEVRGAEVAMVLEVQRVGEEMVAELHSTWDRTLWVNLNFGPDLRLNGRLLWQLAREDDGEGEPLEIEPDNLEIQVHPRKIVPLPPGERRAIARVPIQRLQGRLAHAGWDAKGVQLVARYTSLVSAKDLKDAPAGNVPDLPVHLFTGALTSEPLALQEQRP